MKKWYTLIEELKEIFEGTDSLSADDTYDMDSDFGYEEDNMEEADSEKIPEEMDEVRVYGSPYCSVSGVINVPASIVKAGKKEVIKYVETNFCDVKFGEPDLDFGGTDYEIEDEINGCYNSVDRED